MWKAWIFNTRVLFYFIFMQSAPLKYTVNFAERWLTYARVYYVTIFLRTTWLTWERLIWNVCSIAWALCKETSFSTTPLHRTMGSKSALNNCGWLILKIYKGTLAFLQACVALKLKDFLWYAMNVLVFNIWDGNFFYSLEIYTKMSYSGLSSKIFFLQ